MPVMRRHLAVDPGILGHPVVALLRHHRRDRLAVLGIAMLGRRLLVVEIIADPVASENAGCHHLRLHVSLPVAKKKSVSTIGFRPNLGV